MIHTLIQKRLKNKVSTKTCSIWNVATKNVPVVIGALGTIKKELDQNLELLPGHLSAIELQKLTKFVKYWGKEL